MPARVAQENRIRRDILSVRGTAERPGAPERRASGQDRERRGATALIHYRSTIHWMVHWALGLSAGLSAALGFLVGAPQLLLQYSYLVLYCTSRKIIYGPWEGSAGPGERANERRTMSTVPVNVWTAQLSSPLLPCVPLLVQSCKALLSLLCSLPKTKP
jgi:hypothetical protein